ncbi:MAG: 2-hydroxyacid dehydrogenase [Betaproteobacteria bacterium]
MNGAAIRPTVLLAAHLPDEFVQRMSTRYDLLGPLSTPFPDAVAALPPEDAARVRAVITSGVVNTSRAALAGLPAVGLVCCLGSGYEGVDLIAAAERGIAVTHSPGANASAVADLALGLLIGSVRRLPQADACLRRGEWKGDYAHLMGLVRGLTGRKVGIYGLGEIGMKIAQRAAAFEMEIGYHNRKPRPDAGYPYFATLRELAAWADVLMIAVRAGAANRHAVDAGVLAALGPQGYIVNIARGAVIDETALIHALRDGVIEGAGLDVFEREPDIPDELLALPNVALSPHIAGGTLDAQQAMQRMVVANLDAFFAGRPVVTPVPEALPQPQAAAAG